MDCRNNDYNNYLVKTYDDILLSDGSYALNRMLQEIFYRFLYVYESTSIAKLRT